MKKLMIYFCFLALMSFSASAQALECSGENINVDFDLESEIITVSGSFNFSFKLEKKRNGKYRAQPDGDPAIAQVEFTPPDVAGGAKIKILDQNAYTTIIPLGCSK